MGQALPPSDARRGVGDRDSPDHRGRGVRQGVRARERKTDACGSTADTLVTLATKDSAAATRTGRFVRTAEGAGSS